MAVLKEKLNASRPSEHPTQGQKMSKGCVWHVLNFSRNNNHQRNHNTTRTHDGGEQQQYQQRGSSTQATAIAHRDTGSA
jgi:hypothetical protein